MPSGSMKWRRSLCLGWISGLLFCALVQAAPTPSGSKPLVFLQSWDGAPHHVIQELLRKGRLPNLAKLRDEGVWSRGGVLPAFPSQTAAGHARLWTGAPERVNGISGNSVLRMQRGESTILEGGSGFDGSLMQVEPLWVTAARQKKRTLVWNAPQAYPYTPSAGTPTQLKPELEPFLKIVHGYGNPSSKAGLLDVSGLEAGSRDIVFGSVRAKVWQSELPSKRDAGSQLNIDLLGLPEPKRLLVRESLPGIPQDAVGALLPDNSAVFFLLFSDAQGRLLLFYSAGATINGNGRDLFSVAVDAGGGMIANGPSELYLGGAFGKTLMEGGSGEAEEAYLLVIEQLLGLNLRSMVALLKREPWDLVVNYLPLPDEILHQWYGYVDKDMAPRNPALAKRCRWLIERVLLMQDRHLGTLLAQLGPEDSFLLVSDHGMEGCDRDLVLNVALQKAGYLALDEHGTVDLKRTRAYYGPGTSASVVLNTVDWQDGTVHPEEIPALSEEIGRMLMGLKDPEDGKRLVRGVFLPANQSRDYGGETAGQIYVDAAPGVYLQGGLGEGKLVVHYPPAGRHMFHPNRPEMLAILFARWPSAKPQALEGLISQLVVAPTVCKLLGIEPAPTMEMPSLTEPARP